MTITLNGTTGIVNTGSETITGALTAANFNGASTFGFKNRIINGAMVIDQRNAGASVTPATGAYTLDRWAVEMSQASKFSVQQNAGSVTPPTGFKNYLGATSLSAYTVGASEYFVIGQAIEGYNIADLAFGTADAATVTLSFWVRSSLTGTFGGTVLNSGASRNYVFSYTINAANTWEQKTVTITGDTSGTWLTTNGAGLFVRFSIGAGSSVTGTAGSWSGTTYRSVTGQTSVVGTNGATFYITGVQLEKGSTATSFDYRPYSAELAMCQRYYYRIKAVDGSTLFGSSFNYGTTSAIGYIKFPVDMRTNPTALEQSGTATDYRVFYSTASTNCSSVPTFDSGTVFGASATFTVASGLTGGQGSMLRANTSSAYLGWSAEL